MSFSQALATAVTGMRVTQAGLSIVAANVANAETPGWVRKTATQVPIAAGSVGVGVRIAAINRELDQYIQRQMRVESSGASYAGMRAEFFERLQSIYGVPGAVSTLESAYNEFTSALQVLTTSPEFGLGAQRGRQCRAGAGAAAQRHDRRHPVAAWRRRARACRCGDQGERGDAADCARSTGSWPPPTPAMRPPRTCSTSATSISISLRRLMDIKRRPRRLQPAVGLHQFRRAAGWHQCVDAGVRPAGRDEPVRAVEQRSGDAHGRHHRPEGAERQRRRPPGQQCDPLGRDRRLSRDARRGAGPGADPARRDRGGDGARACPTGPIDGTPVTAGAAGRLRHRPRQSDRRQFGARDLYRQCVGPAAHAHVDARRRSRRAAAVGFGDRPIRTTR